MAFRFLSPAEFEALSLHQRLTYLSDAMEELERLKVPRRVRGWDSLFSQPSQQRQQQQPQQQQQTQPALDSDPSSRAV